MKKIIEYFKNINEEKISHAYIISNTKLDDIRDEIEYVISKYIFKKDIKIDNNADIIILNANDKVKKDEIIDLIKDISMTSQFNNKKVYIIDGCELLNDHSYNALLKTLEEPSSNVYAFLISNNIEEVKDTIVSRCQRINIKSKENDSYDEKTIEIANKILKILDSKTKNISLNKELYSEINDLREFSDILDYLLNYYFEKIKNIEELDNKKELLSEYSKKIIILNNIKGLTKANLNKNLTIDRLMIEMWR